MAIYLYLGKAEACAKEGKREECDRILKYVRPKLHDFSGDQETNIYGNLLLITALNTSLDQSPEAIGLCTKALAIYEQVFRGTNKHRTQALAFYTLARSYAREHKWEEALEAAQTSEYIYNSILQHKAVDDFSRLHALFIDIAFGLKDHKMVDLYAHNHTAIFGPAHPRTRTLVQKVDSWERG